MPSGHDDSRQLRRVLWGRARCPLTVPYELSFLTLREFRTVWVVVEDDSGAIGVGEAVALPGYGWETDDGVAKTVEVLVAGAEGRSADELRAKSVNLLGEHPFAASAVLTALDLPAYLARLRAGLAFPLNAPVAGDAPQELLGLALDGSLSQGCEFVKVKVGRNVGSEKRGAAFLLTTRPADNYRLVFDANQGYSIDEALALAQALRVDPYGRLLWFEQPVDRDDWKAMEHVCRGTGVPVVLDECILSASDIDRAKKIGAAGVKLKSFKNGGIAMTLDLARHARQLGLIVVFGNGVATDIGNFAEFLTLVAGGDLFTPPSESSGFAKMVRPFANLGLATDVDYRLVCRLDPIGAAERLRHFAQSHAAADVSCRVAGVH